MGISGEQTVWSAASDYFRLFRHGFRSLPNDIYSYVLNALESSMSPGVTDGPVSGPKAIITRWMKFSLCFDDIHMDLQRLENGPVGNSVVATVITSFTISSDSLSLVFPNLIKETPANESRSSAKSLSGKLLHQRLVVRGSILFEWDETRNRINKMRSQSDMLTPLLRLLGSLEEVSRVFEGALVSPGCSWPRCIV
ncbi:hypothetical protein PHMEG_00011951 [Phytophthora megakarya]|uniref:Bzip transcription factor n=1 Tax=Phytophthora megakarya TaxID=4795 RepID=A0A225W9Z1_9STRA|nr:hypothetical protein PHMEG_00011951 [Phytophthora megakarya]